MKPRARRVTIAAAVLGAGVVGVLVVLNWGTVRDHVEAWHFQLTRQTETVEPALLVLTGGDPHSVETVAGVLAQRSGLPVICSRAEKWAPIFGAADILRALEENGFRVLEQRFPRRAYVVMRDQGAAQ
jgi:sugar (pentulose or hexulose) kinase